MPVKINLISHAAELIAKALPITTHVISGDSFIVKCHIKIRHEHKKASQWITVVSRSKNPVISKSYDEKIVLSISFMFYYFNYLKNLHKACLKFSFYYQ